MEAQKSGIRNIMQVFVLLVAAAFLVSCGVDQAPVAPDATTGTPSPDSRMLVTFSPDVTPPAAKIATTPLKGRTVSGLFDAAGGTLEINEANGLRAQGDLRVLFTVPAKALSAPTKIAMTVYGNTLSDLVVAFEPGGLTFLQDAILEIWFGEQRVDVPVEVISVWHEYSDGTVIEAQNYWSEWVKKTYHVVVMVPGFSRYGLCDDNYTPDCGF